VDAPGLRLLYVSHGYSTHDRRFLAGFREARYSVGHLQLVGARLDERELPEGAEPIRYDLGGQRFATPLGYYRACRAVRDAVRDYRPDVVLAGPVPTTAFVAALTGVMPLVAMSWGTDLLVDSRRGWHRFAARFALRRCRGVFGDCQAVADVARSLSSVRDERLVIFPWGIDLNAFHPGPSALDLREHLGWAGRPVFICTRSWEPVYAIDVLLRAFAQVCRTHPDARLLLVGDGSRRRAILALIDQLGIRDQVHTPGRIGYALLPDHFRLADYYVSAALSDGTSVSLLEAMGCGLPVIVTEGYGNVEWVTPGRNGWLVEAGNVEALAATFMTALHTPPQALRHMRDTNVTAIRRRANWAENFPQLLRLLEAVAAETPRREAVCVAQ
jgi:L-malate glycosyltransferase